MTVALLLAASSTLAQAPSASSVASVLDGAREGLRRPGGGVGSGLVGEAVSLLGHPDSFWRDDVGYGVVASCAYRKRLLKPEERRALVARLSANLRRGIGESGTNSVLLRSFSASTSRSWPRWSPPIQRSTTAAIGGSWTTPSPTCATSVTCAASSRGSAGSTRRPTPRTC